jgi:hypothetical protein
MQKHIALGLAMLQSANWCLAILHSTAFAHHWLIGQPAHNVVCWQKPLALAGK